MCSIVQVSPHTRRTIEEHDAARRLMFRAREDESLPKGYGGGLLVAARTQAQSHERRRDRGAAADIRDDNFRIQAGEDGIHI